MSFKLSQPDGTLLYECSIPGVRIAMTAARTTFVPPLSLARIEHNCTIKLGAKSNSSYEIGDTYPSPTVIALRDPRMGLDRSLIVDQGIVLDGPLVTIVFNTSEERIRIEKGETVCWLIEI